MEITDAAAKVRDRLQERYGDDLRSVICYDTEEYHTLYLRDELPFDDDELAREINDCRMTSLTREYIDQTAPAHHGPLQAAIQIHERVIKFHFVAGDGRGVRVTLDDTAYHDDMGLIRDLQDTVSRC